MDKMLRLSAVASFFILGLFTLGFADETLTITTYYPSPYGSYNELTANQVKIGPLPINANGNDASLRVVKQDDGNTNTFFYTGFFENQDNSYFNAGVHAAYRGTCSGSQSCWALYGDASGGSEDNYGIGVFGIGDLGPGVKAQSFRGNAIEATGNVIVEGYIQAQDRSSKPNPSDCDESSEYGRMIVVTGADRGLYVCLETGWYEIKPGVN